MGLRVFPVERRDYPGAPEPDDWIGWIIVREQGRPPMAGPYSDPELAGRLRDRYAPEAELEMVRVVPNGAPA